MQIARCKKLISAACVAVLGFGGCCFTGIVQTGSSTAIQTPELAF